MATKKLACEELAHYLEGHYRADVNLIEGKSYASQAKRLRAEGASSEGGIMTADEKALVERAKNPIVTTVMRRVHESRNHKGMIVGMPKVTLDSSQAEYLCRTIAHQSEEIDKLARALVAFAGDKRMAHYECEDAWYSCPKHESYAREDDNDECNCGADDHNGLLDQYAAALAIAKERA